MKTTTAIVAALLLAVCHATGVAAEAEGPRIPESEIAALQGEATRNRASRGSSSDRRRACKSIVRRGTALLEAHPQASNRFLVLGAVLQSQQVLVGLDGSERNRGALFHTCSELARAPDEYAELRLEADLLLSERNLAAKGATLQERKQALTELMARYRGTTAEAKSLMIAILIAQQLQDLHLEETILHTMADRMQGDHQIIEFRRKSLGANLLDAVFSGTYTCADGTSLTFPIDRLGHTCLLYFWSQENRDLEQRFSDVKTMQERFPGRFEVYSFNLDELPDAGEERLRNAGLDWMVLHLPGGRESSAYCAYARKDPNAVLVNAHGHALLYSTMQYDDIPLIPLGCLEEQGGFRQEGRQLLLERSLDDERYLAQMQSLFIGDFLVVDPVGPTGPSLPAELRMVPMDPGEALATGFERTAGSVPAAVLQAIQACFVVPPLRYRLPPSVALTNYEKAEKLCANAIAEHPDAPDLWIVRNRRVISLLGMWNLVRDPKHLDRAVKEAKTALAMELPHGADVVARLCRTKAALRRGEVAELLLPALVEATGGDRAPASALAAAAVLALDANGRELHSRYRNELLSAPEDGNPALWSVASFLRDQHHTYRVLKATHSGVGWSREQRHRMRRNVAALDRPSDMSRMIKADLRTLDGGAFRLPEDAAGTMTLLYFMELPADEESAAVQKELVQQRDDINTVAAFLSDDADRVAALVKANEWTCRTVTVPGGLRNPLVLRYGILNADRMPNLVLLRADGTISWAMSGLPYQIQSNSMAYAAASAVDVNIIVCQMEAALDTLAEGKCQDAVRRFSQGLPPEGSKQRRNDWWASFRLYHRAKAHMGLENWEAALADIDQAILVHRVFSVGNTFHCARIAEMELVKADLLEKLGRQTEAQAERDKAAAPTFEHPRIPFGMYGDDSQIERLSPH